MRSHRTHWSGSDFEEMSWHDNHVHGLRIRAGEPGSGELEFDIDFILEWLRPTESTFAFKLAPATLTFLEVWDLRIEIDYAAPSAGLVPFSIAEIRRERPADAGTYAWAVVLNWPAGAITFRAGGFDQVLRADPIIHDCQHFDHVQREKLLGD